MGSEQFPHPFPVMGHGPNLGSRHRCMDLIRSYQQQGYISACVHPRPEVLETGRDGDRYYGVRCARDSFDIRTVVPGTFGREIASDARGFYGCPHPCHYRRGRWLNVLVWLRDRPREWFDQETWQVKAVVLLTPLWAFLIYRGPETIRALAELVRAALGK
jgi:hypothetical protein